MEPTISPSSKILIIMCGLPGSGKTTYRSALSNAYVISSDDYIETLAKQEGLTYADSWNKYKDMAEAFLMNQVADARMSNAGLVIWDQTNLTAKKRSRIASMFEGYTKYVADFTKVPYELILKRNSERKKVGRDIPLCVLNSMHNSIEDPIYDGYAHDVLECGRVSIKVAENFYD